MDADLQVLYDAAVTVGDKVALLGEQRCRDEDARLLQWRAVDQARAEANAANIKRQADAAEATVAMLNKQADLLLSRRGEAWMALYQYHLDARRTALSTATTDATLTDIVRDAVLMTNAALAGLDAAGV